MSIEDNKSLDIFGIKPISSAIDKTTEGTLKGIGEFLSLVCKPALEELGILLQDKVRNWRLINVVKMLEKAQGILTYENHSLELKSHPRVAISIIEKSSYIDDKTLQEMWAGLFASSCNISVQDDENLIFVDLLQRLTFSQAKILNYSIINCRKILYTNGLVLTDKFTVHCNQIKKISGITDIHGIDRELDYLRILGLIDEQSGGFNVYEDLVANLQPTYLALSLYIKCQGSSDNPDIFWKDEIIAQEDLEEEEVKFGNNENIQ